MRTTPYSVSCCWSFQLLFFLTFSVSNFALSSIYHHYQFHPSWFPFLCLSWSNRKPSCDGKTLSSHKSAKNWLGLRRSKLMTPCKERSNALCAAWCKRSRRCRILVSHDVASSSVLRLLPIGLFFVFYAVNMGLVLALT